MRIDNRFGSRRQIFTVRVLLLLTLCLPSQLVCSHPLENDWVLRDNKSQVTLFHGKQPKIYQICADTTQSIQPLYIELDGSEVIVHPINKKQECIDIEAAEIKLFLKEPGKARGSYACLNCLL